MGGLGNIFKKFFVNKTTVTLFGIAAGLIVLVGFYMYRVNKEVNPVRIPVANKELEATQEITEDDIEYVNVSSDFLSEADVIRNVDELINHYVATGTSIPNGGMFYTTQVVEKKELPNAIFDQIPDGYTIYQLAVDNESTYANSIYPGDTIDLYMKATSAGLLVFGRFITNIEVLAVRDKSGVNVFDETSEAEPAYLLFAVETRYYRYLKLAEFISGMEIIPVSKNNLHVEDVGSMEISSTDLLNLILSQSMEVAG